MNDLCGLKDSAPQRGRILAYSTRELIYDAYSLQGERIVLKSGSVLDFSTIYELHLFNSDTEFRAISTNGEWETSILCKENEPENDIDHFVFSETQFVKQRYCVDSLDEKIVLNNYFSFDDDGFLHLTGYRLAMYDACSPTKEKE